MVASPIQFMPMLDGQLAGDDGGPRGGAVINDLQQIGPCLRIHRRHPQSSSNSTSVFFSASSQRVKVCWLRAYAYRAPVSPVSDDGRGLKRKVLGTTGRMFGCRPSVIIAKSLNHLSLQ